MHISILYSTISYNFTSLLPSSTSTRPQNEMNKSFSPDSKEFTLEKIIEYGFDGYAEKINEVSGAASKELLIETGIADIARTWEDIELDMVSHKDKGHFKIRCVLCVCFSWHTNHTSLAELYALQI